MCIKLKEIIPTIVVENQASFVAGRSLTHNVLIYHDMLRHYNIKTSPRCLMKIDLRKAYDVISWDFIQEVLRGFGILVYFVQLILICITSTTFTIKVNRVGHGYFEGKRGLRQIDPMSLLLCVLVMEYLSRTLQKMSELPSFQFHPCVEHLS